MLFSERRGYNPVRMQLQVEGIDQRLKNSLWNAMLILFDDQSRSDGFWKRYTYGLWLNFFGKTIDTIPKGTYGDIYISDVKAILKDWFMSTQREWYEFYDLIEFTIPHTNDDFIKNVNMFLEREKAGYRIANKHIVQITSEEEIQSIEESISRTEDKYKGVHTHLQSAIKLLSDRENPNYRNSIKESISAVEALCQKITGDDKATLGAALKVLEKQEQVHSALKEGFSKLYGYTSDGDGIRHAIMDDGKQLDFHDAKYMLVTCTAFINLMIGKLEN